VIERGYEGYVARHAVSAYEAGPTTRWLQVKQKGCTVAEDRWQRRISIGVRARHRRARARARPCNSAGSASASLLLLLLERGAFARGLPLAFLLAHGQSPSVSRLGTVLTLSSGVGHVAVGMHRHVYDPQLTQSDD
jgi:hypothetical protein